MILIRNLTKNIHYEPLFKDLNLTIHRGDRIGIVGPNGAGKSTLLKIIASIETADSGEVVLEKERIGYLEQVIPEEDQLQTIAQYLKNYTSHQIEELLTTVGLKQIDQTLTVRTLSGGQKTKLALAKVLLERPTTLLLDEPTNHLDSSGTALLKNIITQTFKGAVVIISHDRSLLNTCVDKIIEFKTQTKNIEEYHGKYNDYLIERAKRQERQEVAYKIQQNKKRQLEARLKEAQLAKSIATRALHTRLEREVYNQEISKPQDRKNIPTLTFGGSAPDGKLITRFTGVTKTLGGRLLLDNASFEMRGSDRILLTGNNGSGKTTITKLLTGALLPDSGEVTLGANVRVGYFDQEHSTLNSALTVEDELFRSIGHKISNIRGLLAAYGFFGDDRLKPIEYLSSGEQVRVMLAKLVHQEFEFLILDEPTNHIDIPSREIIETSLQEFSGSMLIISHDEYFVEKMDVNRVLKIESGKVSEIKN